MRTRDIVLLCFVTAALLCGATGISVAPSSCCFDFTEDVVPKHRVTAYRMTDIRCAKSGIILTTVKGKRLCVGKEKPWVQRIIRHVDERNL
ncbi:C-C motif chemokine 36.1 [Synchiropus splendidus]|uniref:C-C motif chemokine 36.1 n=1 Tax=Synchiropus splendidus TaxID=270530 RepID=UPI00237DA191|nr:C-C motif chemokine 36.1 [Synchiropus splendidus]